MIRLHHISPLALGDRSNEVVPGFREEMGSSVLVEEVEFRATKEEDASQDERFDAGGVGLGVSEGEGGSPV